MKELDYQLKVQKEVTKKLNEISKKQKGPTKEKLKEIIKTERNVFLNAIIDLYNQRTDVERRERRLQKQLNEANEALKELVGFGVVTEKTKAEYKDPDDWECTYVADEYLDKWGVK